MAMDNLPCGAGFRVPLVSTLTKRSKSLALSSSNSATAASNLVKKPQETKAQGFRQQLTERSTRTHSKELNKALRTRNAAISNSIHIPNCVEVEKSIMIEQAKSQRRAEIYALNTILRQLQQEKIAQYIHQQRLMREMQHISSTEMNLVAAIGV